MPIVPLNPGPGPEFPSDWTPTLEQWEPILVWWDEGGDDPDFDPEDEGVIDLLSQFSNAHTGIAVDVPLERAFGGYLGAGDKARLVGRIVTDGEPEIVMLDLPVIGVSLDEADGSVVRFAFAVDPVERFVVTEARQSGDIVIAIRAGYLETESVVALAVSFGTDVWPVDGDIVSISVPGSDQVVPARVVGRIAASTGEDSYSTGAIVEEPLLLVGTPTSWLPTLAKAILDEATLVVTVDE